MAWGLIPITTSQGFNRSVIENDSLIVEKLDVKCFVNKIKYIIDNDLIEQFSYNSYNRVYQTIRMNCIGETKESMISYLM